MPLSRFISRAATALLAVATLAVLVLAVGPHTGAYRTLTILSDSMKPNFEAGDLIVVTPARTSSVRVGDVITYEAPIDGSPVVTHRVVEVLEGGRQPVVRTKGDANKAPDAWTAKLTGETIWRQRAAIPAVGAVIRTLRDERVMTALRYAFPAILLLTVLADIWRPKREAAPAVDRVRLELSDEDLARLDGVDGVGTGTPKRNRGQLAT